MVTYACRYSSGHLILIIQSCQDELGIKCPIEYLQVQVTILVYFLFIYMIPINCKITNFSLYLSLLSLKHNSGQAASLHPIFPNSLPPLPFLFCTHKHTQGKLHVPTMGAPACTRPISILSIQCRTYIQLKLLEIWQLFFNFVCFCGAHPLSMLNIDQHTCNEHIEHLVIS